MAPPAHFSQTIRPDVCRFSGLGHIDSPHIYADDWYNNPEMVGPPIENPSELWLKRDHKHDLAFRPLETALEKGIVGAIYTQSIVFQRLQEATGKFKAIEDLSRYPDWTLQVANIPAAITCTDVREGCEAGLRGSNQVVPACCREGI